jgi:hypothetical protein
MNIFSHMSPINQTHLTSLQVEKSLPPQATQDLTVNIEKLEKDGFTVVEGLFTPDEVEQFAQQFMLAEQKALCLMDTTPMQKRVWFENNKECSSQFWKSDDTVIIQAGKGRYDLYQGFKEGVFASEVVLRNPTLEKLVGHFLVDEFTNYSGLIYSKAGSQDQYWHRDTHTLKNVGTGGEILVEMDDFYFTILIPVTVPLTLENGTTEFMVGSHKLPASELGRCETAQLEVPLGSALVFNGKINHRGKANDSAQDRPALYLVYHKKWYNDQYRKGVN